MDMQRLETRLAKAAITLCDTLAQDLAPERDGEAVTLHGVTIIPADGGKGLEVWTADRCVVTVQTATEAIAVLLLLLAEPKGRRPEAAACRPR